MGSTKRMMAAAYERGICSDAVGSMEWGGGNLTHKYIYSASFNASISRSRASFSAMSHSSAAPCGKGRRQRARWRGIGVLENRAVLHSNLNIGH